MEPIKDIIQKEITEVFDNPIDQTGNKIKLRNVSHENLVKHLKNIPYKTKKGDKIKDSKVNQEKEKVEWELKPVESMEYIGVAQKPINVKQSMLENIIKHSEVINPEEKNMMDNNEVSETKENQTEKIIINKETSINSNESNAQLNVENDFEEIKFIRQEVLNKKLEAEQAQKEADESDKTVQELGVQYTEVQKQLQEAKTRNKEMKKKVLAALRSQSDTLNNAKKQYESVIEDANKRKEANQNKIAEINPKIKTVEDETVVLNNDTAKAEEFLNAIYSNNITEFPYIDGVEEEKIRKIA